jgi:hypothetical protein
VTLLIYTPNGFESICERAFGTLFAIHAQDPVLTSAELQYHPQQNLTVFSVDVANVATYNTAYPAQNFMFAHDVTTGIELRNFANAGFLPPPS